MSQFVADLGIRLLGGGGGGGGGGLEVGRLIWRGGVTLQQGERCELSNRDLGLRQYSFGGITRQATL